MIVTDVALEFTLTECVDELYDPPPTESGGGLSVGSPLKRITMISHLILDNSPWKAGPQPMAEQET